MPISRRFSPLSPIRSALDVAWLAAFATVLGVILLGPRGPGSLDQGVSLQLTPGVQQQVLYRRGSRLGGVTSAVHRDPRGWLIERRFELGAGRPAAKIRLRLRADLSLDHLNLEADLVRVGDLAGAPRWMLEQLGPAALLMVGGECSAETGVCQLAGQLGPRTIQLPITAGRGPVLTGAIYPLLARGVLGRKLEVEVFDPLSLKRQLVTYELSGREQLKLRSGTYDAVRVECQVQGLSSRVWIDREGMVLREEMPLGFTLEHESWRSHE